MHAEVKLFSVIRLNGEGTNNHLVHVHTDTEVDSDIITDFELLIEPEKPHDIYRAMVLNPYGVLEIIDDNINLYIEGTKHDATFCKVTKSYKK